MRILLNRKAQMRQTGETKVWNRSTIIQISIAAGMIVLCRLPFVRDFFGNIINRGVNAADQWSDGKITAWLQAHNNATAISEKELPTTHTVPVEGAEHVIPSKVSDDVANAIRDKISGLMGDHRATGMAKFLQEIAHIDNPDVDTYVVNGDANLMHSADAIRDAVEKAGGKLVTATSENAFGKTYILTAVLPKGLDMEEVLRASSDKSLYDAGATIAKFLPLQGSDFVPPEPVIVHDIISTIDLSELFAGFAFVPEYDKTLGHMIKLVYHSLEYVGRRRFVTITDIKVMKAKDLMSELSKIKKVNNQAISQMNKDIYSSIKYANDIANVYATEAKEEKDDEMLKRIKAIKSRFDTDYTDYLVLYTTLRIAKEGGKDKVFKLPLFAMNENSMQACSLLSIDIMGEYTSPFYMKGMMTDHVTIAEVNKDDNKTAKQKIRFFGKFLRNCVKDMSKYLAKQIGLVYNKKSKTWSFDEKDKENLYYSQIGNFTGKEILDILNHTGKSGDEYCYKYYYRQDEPDDTETYEDEFLNHDNDHTDEDPYTDSEDNTYEDDIIIVDNSDDNDNDEIDDDNDEGYDNEDDNEDDNDEGHDNEDDNDNDNDDNDEGSNDDSEDENDSIDDQGDYDDYAYRKYKNELIDEFTSKKSEEIADDPEYKKFVEECDLQDTFRYGYLNKLCWLIMTEPSYFDQSYDLDKLFDWILDEYPSDDADKIREFRKKHDESENDDVEHNENDEHHDVSDNDNEEENDEHNDDGKDDEDDDEDIKLLSANDNELTNKLAAEIDKLDYDVIVNDDEFKDYLEEYKDEYGYRGYKVQDMLIYYIWRHDEDSSDYDDYEDEDEVYEAAKASLRVMNKKYAKSDPSLDDICYEKSEIGEDTHQNNDEFTKKTEWFDTNVMDNIDKLKTRIKKDLLISSTFLTNGGSIDKKAIRIKPVITFIYDFFHTGNPTVRQKCWDEYHIGIKKYFVSLRDDDGKRMFDDDDVKKKIKKYHRFASFIIQNANGKKED